MALFAQIRGLEIELSIVNKKMGAITDGLQAAGANFSIVAGRIVTEGVEKNIIHQSREAMLAKQRDEKLASSNTPTLTQKTLTEAGVRSLERVKEFCTSFGRECSEIRTTLHSPALTQSSLQAIRTNIAEKRNIINNKLADLKRLEEKLEAFSGANPSSDALKNISASVSMLDRELAGLSRLEKDLQYISPSKTAAA